VKLRLLAPAKINLTLEVIRRRDDGYHDIRSLLQTLALHDVITISPSDDLDVRYEGLHIGPAENDLVRRAAQLLRREAGNQGLGASIELEKNIPVAAGLGGGSSDAAATLRGLNRFWDLGLNNSRLSQIGAALGSDVPFFLTGGTAVISGRGDEVEPLPDMAPLTIVIALAGDQLPRKTARMYGALRPEHFTSGKHTGRLLERLKAGKPVRDSDIFNVFEFVLSDVMPLAAQLQRECEGIGQPPHLAGAGPALFFLPPLKPEIERHLDRDCATLMTTTSTRPESTSWEELQ
jgi:4-diphosphocytidyl-2-C-methyl-D-erythritol kinase